MHYCLHLFTRKEPTEKQIEKIMEPYMYGNELHDKPIAWDWYTIGGRYHNTLETKSGHMCDGAPVNNLSDQCDLGCYAFIDMDENALARNIWVGFDYAMIQNFDELYQKVLEASKDGYITVIDIHE